MTKKPKTTVIPVRLTDATIKRLEAIRMNYVPLKRGYKGPRPYLPMSFIIRWVMTVGLERVEAVVARKR